MDYVKLWTTVHDDPDMRRLSHRAFREFIYAWSWCGKHETDGVYDVMAGLMCRKSIDELLSLSPPRLVPIDADHYAIHGWAKRQVTRSELDRKRALTRERVTRYREQVKRVSNATEVEVEVEEQVEVKKPTPLAPRKRDAMFEAVCEACGIDWGELTDTARGSLNKAVAQIRAVCQDPDEVARRARNWPYETPLTPPSLAKHWPNLGTKRNGSTLVRAVEDVLEGKV